MSDVDLLQNSEEAVAQMQEEANAAERERLQAELDADPVKPTAGAVADATLELVDVSDIESLTNIRTDRPDIHELAVSIRQRGLLSPIAVRETPDGDKPYQLFAGARRLEASKLAGLQQVPARVIRGLSEAEAYELMFLENIHQAPMTTKQKARGFALLLNQNDGMNAAELAQSLGLKGAWVATWVKALDHPLLAKRVADGDLGITAADLIRKGLDKGAITEDEANDLADAAASGDLTAAEIGEKIKPTSPEAPEGYDEWADADAKARYEAAKAPEPDALEHAADAFLDAHDGGDFDFAPDSAAQTVYSTPDEPAADAQVDPDNPKVRLDGVENDDLEAYLVARLLRDHATGPYLHRIGIQREGVLDYVRGLNPGERAQARRDMARALLAADPGAVAQIVAGA